MNHQGKIVEKFQSKWSHFHLRKLIWRCLLHTKWDTVCLRYFNSFRFYHGHIFHVIYVLHLDTFVLYLTSFVFQISKYWSLLWIWLSCNNCIIYCCICLRLTPVLLPVDKNAQTGCNLRESICIHECRWYSYLHHLSVTTGKYLKT